MPETAQPPASDAPMCSVDLTRDEAYLLQNGICSFDSASGVSQDELARCAEDIVALVKDSMRRAEAPRLEPQNT